MSAPSPLSAEQIRSLFLNFFKDRGHEVVPSSPLVPQNDPTLLFVNAGMVPFKDVFTGRESRPYKRATSSQRCLRAGGKHNDLANVGYTPRHHTLFEMLGNFSFGDYFKEDSIKWAWSFLTEAIGIPKERLVVSVFSGEGENAPYDEEAYDLWAQILPSDRIYKCGASENFWQMGDTGPCGPCSEIHIFNDGIAPPNALRDGKFGPEYEEDKYLELWNLVFMQYEKHEDRTLSNLPRPSIDTGAGLERVAAAQSGAKSNYETTALKPLVDRAKELAGVKGFQGTNESPYQVIADHARATAFLIADGVFPDRADRPYVLRRIMRRAIRYGTRVGLDEPFFHEMCAKTVECFQDAYPELKQAKATIEEVVRGEEESFRRTLNRGLRRVETVLEDLAPKSKSFPVDTAAELYDTYGFPVDLTGLIAKEKGLSLDESAVEDEVKRRQGADDNFKGQGKAVSDIYFEAADKAGRKTNFTGYERTDGASSVLAIVVGEQMVDKVGSGVECEVVIADTPFYGESGGQSGDQGSARGEKGELVIVDTQKRVSETFFHLAKVTSGEISVGDKLALEVNVERRDAIQRNHSATHLLHYALRKVLGEHVTQKGSLVRPDDLRFDFSHGRSLTVDEKHAVEQIVNRAVFANAETTTQEMALDAAKEAGAIGLFGEKYGADVRVVTIGEDSTELCGGTHVRRSGDIGTFMIVSEGGVAQGVRRIEAITGQAAMNRVQLLSSLVDDAAGRLHAGAAEHVLAKLDRLQKDYKERVKEVADLKRELAAGGGGDDTVLDIEGIKVLAKNVGAADPKTMRQAADTLRDRLGSGLVVLGGEANGKAHLLVAATKDLAGKVHAGKLISKLAEHIEGRGGGRPDMAQAGGAHVQGLASAIADVEAQVRAQLSK